jgi:outer membrane protein OmpA-like peptidoglycan-associated protein
VRNLNEFAKALYNEKRAGARFIVEGHTDARGGESYNLDLSERRAAAVAKFLHDEGMPPQQVSSIGLGETRPRVPDPLDPINRRVEMRVSIQ